MNTKTKPTTAADAPEAPRNDDPDAREWDRQDTIRSIYGLGPSSAPAKPAHTPGPWKDTDRNDHPKAMDGYVKIDAERQGIAYVFGDTKSEREANAHLIAAAPELLAVLRILVQQEWHPHLSTLDAARAAIAKAEGIDQ